MRWDSNDPETGRLVVRIKSRYLLSAPKSLSVAKTTALLQSLNIDPKSLQKSREEAKVPKQITVPFCYKGLDDNEYECLGWEDGDPETGRLVIRLAGDDSDVHLGPVRTLNLLERLKIDPKSIRGKKKKETQTVNRRDWDRFLRLKDSLKDLEEMSSELITNWRNHLEYVRDNCPGFDDDDVLEEMDDLCLRIPRTIRYIRTGVWPSKHDDDDAFDHYDRDEKETYHFVQTGAVSYRATEYAPKPKKVHVVIEDISTGDL